MTRATIRPYLWMLYGLLPVKWQLFDDYYNVARGSIGNYKFARPKGKDLAIFVWRPAEMPDPKRLVCASCFSWKGTEFPEFDRFGLFSYEEALSRVGKNMARVLTSIPRDALYEASR